METENDNQLPFLDTLIQRSKNGKLSSSIFRKPTHTNPGTYLGGALGHGPPFGSPA